MIGVNFVLGFADGVNVGDVTMFRRYILPPLSVSNYVTLNLCLYIYMRTYHWISLFMSYIKSAN
jgi:hypothetical protein